MRDLLEMGCEVGIEFKDLPEMERRTKLCDLLLEELKTLNGKDLSYYLSEFVFDKIQPGTRIVLKFPAGTHIVDTPTSEGK